jgi:hypothetical protein
VPPPPPLSPRLWARPPPFFIYISGGVWVGGGGGGGGGTLPSVLVLLNLDCVTLGPSTLSSALQRTALPSPTRLPVLCQWHQSISWTVGNNALTATACGAPQLLGMHKFACAGTKPAVGPCRYSLFGSVRLPESHKQGGRSQPLWYTHIPRDGNQPS